MAGKKRKDEPAVTAEQANSDPWPYLMVDRSVEPAVSLLSTRLGVTPQHARGGLVGFWGNCADPRDLEKLHAEGKREVVFNRNEVTLRFALAMAVDKAKVDADELVAMRLLQPVPGGDDFRVRGMSRYFKPLAKRLQFRATATAGGKARAGAKRGPNGRFLTVTGGGPSAGPSAGSSAGSSGGPSAGAQVPNVQQSDQPATTTAVSGQRSAVRPAAARAENRPANSTVSGSSKQVDAFAWMQAEAKKKLPGRSDEDLPIHLVNALLGPALDKVGRAGVELAWRKFLDDGWATQEGWPTRAFAKQWPKYHNMALASPAAADAPELRSLV